MNQMPPLTTTGQINAVNIYYSRDLLIRAQPLLVHTMFAQVKDIPQNHSMTIRFRRYANLPTAKDPLVEGITPNGSQMAKTDITGTAEQYGDYIMLSDKLTMTIEDPVRMEANAELADQFANTVDELTRDELVTGTNVLYGGNATSTATVEAGDVITQALVEDMEEILKLNKARYITDFMDPTVPFNTVPLPPSFWGIVHTNITRRLRSFADFTKVELYSKPEGRMVGEIGKVSNTRFVETVNAKVFTGAGVGGVDVYATLMIAKWAYGITRLAGAAVQNIAKPLGSAGTGDPLDQRETVGWKATFLALILNDDFIGRIEHTRV